MALSESDVDSKYTVSTQVYGVALLPISIAFIFYAMLQCKFVTCICKTFGCSCSNILLILSLDSRRASMIRTAAPGVWLDIKGPMVLSVILSLTLVSQFAIKIYSLM